MIEPLSEIGSNRPLCQFKIRVATDLKTSASQYSAAARRRKGIPVDQCGHRGDFRFGDRVLCRAHAGQEALRMLIEAQK